METIDNFDVIEVIALLSKGEFSLGGWLLEALAGFAASVATTAVCLFASV
jgi:hypothetical protein